MAIAIPVEIDGKKSILKFKQMSIEEGADWAAKMKSRVLLRESLNKQQEKQAEGVIKPEEEGAFLALGDRIGDMDKKVFSFIRGLVKFVTDPEEAEVETMITKDPNKMLKVFQGYLEAAFPTEEDEKK